MPRTKKPKHKSLPARPNTVEPGPLDRIADLLELHLKLALMRLPDPITIEELREAELYRPEGHPKPVVLNQTGSELDALARTLAGSAEERDYMLQAEGGAGLTQRLAALRGQGSDPRQ